MANRRHSDLYSNLLTGSGVDFGRIFENVALLSAAITHILHGFFGMECP